MMASLANTISRSTLREPLLHGGFSHVATPACQVWVIPRQSHEIDITNKQLT
jgi:hypothetical protein